MIAALAFALLLGAPTQAPEPAAGPETEELRAAQALVQSISKSVEELRGLTFKRPVAVRIVTPERARAHFLERASKLLPPEKLRVDQAVYEQLGLAPKGSNLLEVFLDLLQEQARGYYDPGSDTFFLVGGLQGDLLRVIMAHELTHALDDQYHDLDTLAERAPDDDDGTALGALVEGSGTLVMSVYLVREVQAGRLGADALVKLGQSEAGSSVRLAAAPPYIQRMLVAPYALGMAFLLRGNLLGLVSGVNKADLEHVFAHPPASTEQVLHPEKYWDDQKRDAPGVLKLPDLSAALGRGYKLTGQGTLGELGLAVLAGARMPDPTSITATMAASWTNAAAQGWKADRYHYYASEAGGVTVLLTQWDSEEDAREFQAALLPVAGRHAYRYASAVLLVGGATRAQADELSPLALSAARP